MFTPVRKLVVFCWDFVFNHEVSPLRNIPDVAIRHYVLQALGLMWAVAFAVAAGSYTFLAVSVIGHTVLIAAAAITVATWTAATEKPELFVLGFARQEQDGPKGQNNTDRAVKDRHGLKGARSTQRELECDHAARKSTSASLTPYVRLGQPSASASAASGFSPGLDGARRRDVSGIILRKAGR